MIRQWIAALVVAYLPGAAIMRVPWWHRADRARLPADERAFWSVMLSVVLTVSVVMALGLLGRYSFERLIWADGAFVVLVAMLFRQRLVYGDAARPTWHAAIPIAIVALGVWLYFPPSEYVIGGKDPGTYVNEGVQLAQRGELVVHDPDVAGMPAELRNLFFPSYQQPTYYSSRFMGFWIMDPDQGTVQGQFPGWFPASIAVGYGLNGLSGARQAIGVWAILGLLAVYYAGAHWFGRMAAAAATLLLAINVITVWFARYPNAELVMQAMIFASFLAWTRAADGDRPFFGAVAGLLLGLMWFLRFDIVFAVAAVVATLVLTPLSQRRAGAAFAAMLTLTTIAGIWYLVHFLSPYIALPVGFVQLRGGWWILGGAATAAVVTRLILGVPAIAAPLRRAVPLLLAVAIAGLAVFAYFFRYEGNGLAYGDAIAFQSFGWYVTAWGLAAITGGVVLLIAKRLWEVPIFFLTFLTYSLFFFYKIRISYEHFWAARRFLAVILPAALLCVIGAAAWAAAAAFARQSARTRMLAVGVTVVATAAPFGVAFWRASTPVLHYVEYAGMIPKLEQMASQLSDRDLLIVEPRNAGSDVHVLAVPLAYIYARHVLMLDSVVPDKPMLEAFVSWATSRFDRVLFLGSGGTDLLTRGISAEVIESTRFSVPEYESSYNAYPRSVRRKDIEYGLYRLRPGTPAAAAPIDFAIGQQDDLNVIRFYAKERRPDTGMTFRWTGPTSWVLLLGVPADARHVTLWMSDGGRPTQAPAPVVEVAIEQRFPNVKDPTLRLLGTATPVDALQSYTFELPPDLAAWAAAQRGAVRLRLRVPTWNPGELLQASDTRNLGVIVTRVEVR